MDTTQSTGIELPLTLDAVRIENLPSTAYYISNFISEEEEHNLLQKIASAPKPRWKQLSHRRLQTWPSDLIQNRLIDSPLPEFLTQPIIPRLKSLRHSQGLEAVDVFACSPHKQPNHVLVNEYAPGIGIMPHKDGAAYHPVVCTVSLGASLCLGIYRSKDDGILENQPAWRILQEPRSLLVITEALYTDYLHGISDAGEDADLSESTVANWCLLRSRAPFSEGRNVRETRTSLTYRDVMKVSRLGSRFGVLKPR